MKNEFCKHQIDSNRSIAGFLGLFVKGFCMGIADVIPGISGGTIAFMLEIYQDLINAIRSFDLRFAILLLRGRFVEASCAVPWRFLGAVLAGIVAAILMLSKLVLWLLTNHPVLLNAFFFGLILATVPIIARAIRNWDVRKFSVLCVSGIFMYFFVQLIPVSTPETWWFVFLSGAVSICAMALPGISGAFVLLLLGKYQFILNAVHQRESGTVLIFIAGIVVGILSFVRVLGWLLNKYHDMTIAVLTGFVAGSLNKIWPWKKILQSFVTDSGKVIVIQDANVLPAAVDVQFFWAVALACAGFAAALLLHAIPQRKKGTGSFFGSHMRKKKFPSK